MNKHLNITDSSWHFGSYYRIEFLGDSLYACYFYKDISFILDGASVMVQDECAGRLLADGVITLPIKEAYEKRLQDFFEKIECYDQWSLEQIYSSVHIIRKQFLGAGVLEGDYRRQADREEIPGKRIGPDQRELKKKALEEKEAILFILSDPAYLSCMKEDLKAAGDLLKERYVVAGSGFGDPLLGTSVMKELLEEFEGIYYLENDGNCVINLSKVSHHAQLQKKVGEKAVSLFIYGEDGFFHCRSLDLPAVIQAVPKCYYAKALAGVWEEERFCTFYVPPHFDIYPYVRLTEKSRVTYAHLAYLSGRYGREIYELDLPELYRRYPQVFFNIYGEGGGASEEEDSFPIEIRDCVADQKNWYSSFCLAREKAVSSYMEENPGIRYLSTYFDEEMNQREIPWGTKEKQNGILVQGVIISHAADSQVIISQPGAQSPRTLIRDGGPLKGLRIISNFLFFLTPKLAAHYNYLRRDRPQEQIHMDGGHLDYMMREERGGRVESFPLYRKACIALKNDGSFLFCHYELGGGTITINGKKLSWRKEDVNKNSNPGPVAVYTPYGTSSLTKESSREYRTLVGEGRINLVIIQQSVICLREGEVVLPSIGVVLSLEKDLGETLISGWKLNPLKTPLMEPSSVEPSLTGYYDCGCLTFTLGLCPPESMDPEEWRTVKWAFGGGMSLIQNGISLFETESQDTWLEAEGWFGPLSRQTQESEIHKLGKHPRTAVGITEKGELFILVFSGRTAISTGADYVEMGRIARILIPSVKEMMNVDGGGSSVLGIAVANDFVELSYPATSYNSCAGMVRQINTILCLKQ